MSNAYDLSISQMAVKFNVTLRTLRFYESAGLLHPTRSGLTRIYSAKDQARLQLILKGKRLGFTLTEIQKIIVSSSDASALPLGKAQIENKLAAFNKKRGEVEVSLAELRRGLERFVLSPD